MNIILKIFSIYFRVLFRKRQRRANIHVYTVFLRNQKLLFGSIMMFDFGMFLLSVYTVSQTTLVDNTGLNAE